MTNLKDYDEIDTIFEDLNEYFVLSQKENKTEEETEQLNRNEIYKMFSIPHHKGLAINQREMREALKKLTSLYYMPVRNRILQLLLRYENLEGRYFEDAMYMPRTTLQYHFYTLVDNGVLDKTYFYESVSTPRGQTKVRISVFYLNPKIKKLLTKYRLYNEIYSVLNSAYLMLDFYESNFPDKVHTTNTNICWWLKDPELDDLIQKREKYERAIRRLNRLIDIMLRRYNETLHN